MEHIKQNDLKCYPQIRDYGCFFRSCGLVAEYKALQHLTAEQINNGWDFAKKNDWINEEDNVKDSASIINYFLHLLGKGGKFVEVGTFKDGVTTYYPWTDKQPEYKKIDALIQKVGTNGYYGTHFRLVDKRGALIEDPHEPPIKAQKYYYSILYAYVKKGE